MKRLSYILIGVGIIWILQGLNILKSSSFMTGQIEWAVAGLVSAAIGVWLLRRPVAG